MKPTDLPHLLKKIHKEEYFDLLAFVVIFIIVFFFFIFNTQNNSFLQLSSPKKSIQCTAYTSFEDCTAAHTSGQGCAWYAECDRCAANGTQADKVCE